MPRRLGRPSQGRDIVADGVGADALLRHRRHEPASSQCVALDQGVDSEPSHGLTVAIQENAIATIAAPDQHCQFRYRQTPQGAVPLLAAFSENSHRRRGQLKVADSEPGRLVSTSAGVIEKQK